MRRSVPLKQNPDRPLKWAIALSIAISAAATLANVVYIANMMIWHDTVPVANVISGVVCALVTWWIVGIRREAWSDQL